MKSQTPPDEEFRRLLDLAGPDWAANRPWIAAPAESTPSGGHFIVDGPGFLYRWEIDAGPVLVSFIGDGRHSFQVDPGHMLALSATRGELRIQTPGRYPIAIGGLDPAAYHRITDLLAQTSTLGRSPSWQASLGTAGAAMQMATLAHAAATQGGDSSNETRKAQKKDQLVTQLHEWLGPNLGQSVKLGDAAARFDKSPRQLIRILKETTGTGFAEHLNMHRLIFARSLLMRTAQSVQQIASASGFNSREQFIRSFNKAFGWTPLQFRKAWNKASLSKADLAPLCTVSERSGVRWTAPGENAFSPTDDTAGDPHTVVVANARHEIVELFWISPVGKSTRIDVIEHGGMSFITRDRGGSAWQVLAPGSGFNATFVTPDDHAIAIVH